MTIKEYIKQQHKNIVDKMIKQNTPDVWNTYGVKNEKWKDSTIIVSDADYSLESKMIQKAKEDGIEIKEPLLQLYKNKDISNRN